MKLYSSTLIFFLLLILLYCILSCGEPFNLSVAEIENGIQGVVTDTSGKALENVTVFCLYFTHHVAQDIKTHISIEKVSDIGDFEFSLEQNFPNPFSNSTFIRFSLPDRSLIHLNIVNKIENEKVLQYSAKLSKGYYQKYLNNIVDSLQLRNGIYRYSLNALLDNGTNYSDNKELFIISDKGEPNSKTDIHGQYSFDYKYSFAGDTLVIKNDENSSSTMTLTSTVNLLFTKAGYNSTIIRATLYPDTILIHNIVLTKER